MRKFRVPVNVFDDLVTQMGCPVVQQGTESEREGTHKDKKGVDQPLIKKYVTFEFCNQEDEDTWKKLKGIE